MKLRIGVISAQVFKVPPPGYSGLEMIAYQVAKGLAARGHSVVLYAPDGSKCPGCDVHHTGPPGGWSEHQAFNSYWPTLSQCHAIIDHSVVGDSSLLVRVNGNTRWTTMRELYEWALSNGGAPDLSGGSCEIPIEGVEVPSAVDAFGIQWKTASCIIRHKRKDSIHKVQTKSGLTVEVTAGHSIMVAGSGGSLDAVRADQSSGQFAVTAKRLPCNTSDVEWLPQHEGEDHRTPLSDDLLTLFGLWIGDGCYDRVSVRLSCGDQCKHVADSVAGQFRANCLRTSFRPDVNHQINSSRLVGVMRRAGFVGTSHSKRVPDWVFGLSRRQIGLFLRGYFSADGHCGRRLCLGTVNHTLAEQTTVLLAMCGIRSTLHRLKEQPNPFGSGSANPMWEVNVPIDQWEEFVQIVGFVQEDRNDKLRAGKVRKRSWRGDVPYRLVRERMRSNSKESVISLCRLEHVKGAELADRFTESDIAWRKIITADQTNRTDEFVYDLSVPGTENFFVGLVCCHNSWEKHAYGLRAEGVLKSPILGVWHAPADRMYQTLPPGDKHCFVFISDDHRAHFEALFGRKGRTCHNGIDLEFYKPMTIARSNRALFLGRFSSIKGADLAIRACREAGVGLDLVGDTSITNEPDYHRECAALCDGEQIKMCGASTRGGCVRWLSQAHVMIHANERFREPFGLAPVESMACGTPVICWDYGAMRETVIHGSTGFLINSYPELVSAVKLAFTHPIPDTVRSDCRSNASRFSVEAMCQRYEQLCFEAINTGGW